ncbi:hypothetical protein [Elioraea sp.]|uniref:hypothetical protein n=1 Tax=Elioraea sp. TaxID=2185103 RepID=UPI0025C44FAF|nr:hypothetical protein [Elioraea sp.]
MEKWTIATPLAGIPWTIPGGVEATLAFTADVKPGDAGMVIVSPDASLLLTYAEGVRTDPGIRPRAVAGGSLLSYVVTEVTEQGPLYVIALNRASGG